MRGAEILPPSYFLKILGGRFEKVSIRPTGLKKPTFNLEQVKYDNFQPKHGILEQ
jgi:hypothetical protein